MSQFDLLKSLDTKTCPGGLLGCCKAIRAVKYDEPEQASLKAEIDWCIAHGLIVTRLYPSKEALSLLAGMAMLITGEEL